MSTLQGKPDQHITHTPRLICVWPLTIHISHGPHIVTFYVVLNRVEWTHCP
jgi:hypothetical protein